MAFKNRFRSLLGLDHKSRESIDLEEPDIGRQEAIYKDDVKEFDDDPRSTEEVIAEIEEQYFEEKFDSSQHELEKIKDCLELDELDRYRNQRRRELQAVSKKFYTKVLDKQTAYMQELQRVIDIQGSLLTAMHICESGRRQLDRAKRGVSEGGLGILAKHRKKQHLLHLLHCLRTIKTLQKTDVRLREMLQEEDYAGAINLCLECEKAARAFKHYSCISELSSNLQDTLIEIEKQLDIALGKTCENFEPAHYERLQTAFRYLGKTQIAMDQLHNHFMNAISNTAFITVLRYVEKRQPDILSEGGTQSIQYTSLCKQVAVEDFSPCLVDICKALWEVMNNYHHVMRWHEHYDPAMSIPEEGQTEVDAVQPEVAEVTFTRNYIRQKLDHGLNRIWKEVQEKIRVYVIGTDLSYFKYDDFINVLDIVNRLISIGEEFCGSKSKELHDSIHSQTIRYFKNYHRSKMEELRMFLENEMWELCPVKATFTLRDLQEFRFLKPSKTLPVRGHRRTESGNIKVETCYFTRYANHGNPFDVQQPEQDSEETIMQNGVNEGKDSRSSDEGDEEDDDDIPDELKMDYVDEKTGETPEPAPVSRKPQKNLSRSIIITNTTLNVLRLLGKYMQMMNVLKPIAFDVVICMSQLFDYYLYAVARFFAPSVLVDSVNVHDISSKMKGTLKKISENLILQVSQEEPAGDDVKVPCPHLSVLVDLTRADNLFGLSERIIATESMTFLATQFEHLKCHLENMVPHSKKAFLTQFYSQTVSVAQELRYPIYRAVSRKVIDYDQTLQLMCGVKWDIKEIMSQHNAYVDILVREFQVFSMKLSQLSRLVPLPKEVSSILWDYCIRLSNQTFVEGFASAKKCSNEGRALMHLDFQQYLLKLEKLVDIRPIPQREFVETYIKAFYLTENDMEKWIRGHKEYSAKHKSSLVTCVGGSHITKKAKQKLLALIEEQDKTRIRT